MALNKRYVRNGRNQIIGNVTSGFNQGSEVVRDNHGQILGRTNELFHTTRRTDGSLVSLNTSDPGLLIPKK
jgi:hypothetical protein